MKITIQKNGVKIYQVINIKNLSKMKEKKEELSKLKKIPKSQLTDEQKERIKQLTKEIVILVLQAIINFLTFRKK